MPDARRLLSRWSRLKRADGGGAEAAEPDPGEKEDVKPDLPPVQSLGPHSDYTLFMRRNVPAALRRAALRQAWTSNPAIAQHKPLVDYDWDFHAPGYGKLWPGDDPAKLLAGLFAPIRRAERDAEEAAEASGGSSVDDRPEPPWDEGDQREAPTAGPIPSRPDGGGSQNV